MKSGGLKKRGQHDRESIVKDEDGGNCEEKKVKK